MTTLKAHTSAPDRRVAPDMLVLVTGCTFDLEIFTWGFGKSASRCRYLVTAAVRWQKLECDSQHVAATHLIYKVHCFSERHLAKARDVVGVQLQLLHSTLRVRFEGLSESRIVSDSGGAANMQHARLGPQLDSVRLTDMLLIFQPPMVMLLAGCRCCHSGLNAMCNAIALSQLHRPAGNAPTTSQFHETSKRAVPPCR